MTRREGKIKRENKDIKEGKTLALRKTGRDKEREKERETQTHINKHVHKQPTLTR